MVFYGLVIVWKNQKKWITGWFVMKMSQMQFQIDPDCMKMSLRLRSCGVKWNGPLLAIAFSIYGIMHTMTFNGQQIALRHFSNSYEKTVYADIDHIQKLAFIIMVLELVTVS